MPSKRNRGTLRALSRLRSCLLRVLPHSTEVLAVPVSQTCAFCAGRTVPKPRPNAAHSPHAFRLRLGSIFSRGGGSKRINPSVLNECAKCFPKRVLKIRSSEYLRKDLIRATVHSDARINIGSMSAHRISYSASVSPFRIRYSAEDMASQHIRIIRSGRQYVRS